MAGLVGFDKVVRDIPPDKMASEQDVWEVGECTVWLSAERAFQEEGGVRAETLGEIYVCIYYIHI